MNCLNEKDIINTYKNFGYDVFKIDFDGYKSIIHFKDKNEYKYKCSYEWVKHHNNFKPVIVSNPYSIDNIKQYILNKKLNVTLLSTEFEGVNIPLVFVGECGHKFEKDWHHFQRTHNVICPKCSFKKAGKNRKRSNEEYRLEYLKHGFVLLDDREDIKNSTPLLCQNEEGFKGYISYANLSFNKRFAPFVKTNNFVNYNIKLFLSRYCNTILLSDYISDKEKLLLQCECGEIFERTWSFLRQLKGLRCDHCSNIVSFNELVVEKFLKKQGIQYKRQYSFNDCSYKRKLFFDFYISEYNTVIEVNGEQHYEPVTFGGVDKKTALLNFEKQQKRDKIKEEYCQKYKINLLIISYEEIKNNSFKQKILDIKD